MKARRQMKLVHDFLLDEAIAADVHDKTFELKIFGSTYTKRLRERLDETNL